MFAYEQAFNVLFTDYNFSRICFREICDDLIIW